MRKDDLLLWYDFDDPIENAKVVNQAGHPELDGDLSGPLVQEVADFGSALRFDGGSNKITVPYHALLDPPDGYTVAIWMKSELSNEGWVGVFGRPGRFYNFWAGDSNRVDWFIHHRYRDGATGSTGPGDVRGFTQHEQWYQVVLTNDGTTSATYVNGVERVTGTIADFNYSASNLYIGANLDNGNGAWYEGLMEDVRLYGVGLSAAEVAEMYNDGDGDFNAPPVITITGDNPARIAMGGTYSDAGATASDPEGDTLSAIRTEYIPPGGMVREGDLVARWDFDTDAKDASGNGNDGNFQGDAGVDTGKFGMALNLDGLGDFVSIPQFNGVKDSAAFTISAWINLNSLGDDDFSGDGGILATDGTFDSVLFWVDYDGGQGPEPATSLTFNAGDPAEPTNKTSMPEGILQAGQWHQITAVMNGLTRKIYVDGQLKATEDAAVATTASLDGKALRIGSWDVDGNLDFEGLIDELRVYSVALPADDVASLYNDGNGDVQAAPTNVDTSGPADWIVRYSVDDDQGNITVAERKVRVFDPLAPVLESSLGIEVTHEQGTDFTLPVITAKDAGGSVIPDAVITPGGSFDKDVAGAHVLSYDYTDTQGRPAETLFVTVNVVDTTPPVLDLNGLAATKHLLGIPYNDAGATALDSVDGAVVVQSSLYVWDQVIARGYQLASRPETLMVFDQNAGILPQPPLGEVVFKEKLSFNNDAAFQAIGSGITANDNFQNLFMGVFQAKVAGEYEFGMEGPDDLASFWLDLDQDGVFELDGSRGSEWMTQGTRGGYSTVQLQPGVYKFGIGHMEGGGGSRLNARFKGPEGGGPSVRQTIHPGNDRQLGLWGSSNPIDVATAGDYTITYTATDAAGNSTTATRTVTVTDAVDLPVITLQGGELIELAPHAGFTEPGYTVASAFGDVLDAQGVVVSGSVDTSILGDHVLRYNFFDAQGLPAEPVARIVRIADTTAPEITLEGEAEITITNTDNFTDPGATIADNHTATPLFSTNLGFPDSGLVLHLDASALGLSEGDPVSIWHDLSGSSNHFDQVEGEPTYAASGINGMPAVEINGQDLLYTNTSFGRTYSAFSITRLSGQANERLVSSRNSNWIFGYFGGLEDQMHADAWVSNNTHPATTHPHLYVATNRSNNNTRFYADTRDLSYIPTRNGLPGMIQFGGYQSGAERGWGFISEFLVYNREVTEQERLNIQTYLNAKYGLNGLPQTPVPELGTPGSYTLHYVTRDESGNFATTSRTVTVTEDPEKPVITLAGDVYLTIEAGSAWEEPGISLATIGGTPLDETEVVVSAAPNTSALGKYVVTYDYTDATSSKIADRVSREIEVVDTTPPTITLAGEAIVTLEKGTAFTDPGATANDIIDGDLPAESNLIFPSVGIVLDLDATFFEGTLNDGDVVATAWEDASAAGNHMDKLEGAGALWIADGLNGEPVLRFNGDSYMNTTYNFDALANGYTIFTIARYSGAKKGRVISSDSRNWLYGFHGGYTGCWHAEGWIINTDAGGDTDWHLHSGTITADADPMASMWKNGKLLVKDNRGSNNGVYKPGRLGLGGWNSATNQSSHCEVARVLLYDSVLADVQRQTAEAFLNARYSLNGKTPADVPGIDVNTPGTYTVVYASKDSQGNQSSAVRTVHVVEDLQAPVLTLQGDPEIFITIGGTYTEPGVSITDTAGAEPANLNITGEVDTNTLGTYSIQYSYTSTNGKSAEPIARQVHIIDDVPPVITLNGEATVQLILGADYTDSGATVADNASQAEVHAFPDNPAAIYRFSDLVAGGNDTSGNFKDGELQSGAMVVPGGKFGNGLFIPNVLNARLDLGGNAIDILEDEQWSFAAWFKNLYPRSGTWRSIVSGNTDYHIMVEANSDDLGLYAQNRGNFRNTGFPLLVASYEGWHHITAVGRKDKTDFFIDGLKVGSSDRSSSSELRYIGNRGDWWFAEVIDEVYIYQRALSDSEAYHIQFAQPEIDTGVLGKQYISWFAADEHGNRAQALRTIEILPDPDARYIELLGESEMTIEAGDAFDDPGSQLVDINGNVVAGQDIVVNGIPAETNTPGEYIITYNSTSAQGKISPEKTRVLQIVDTTPPVIELIGNNPLVLPLGTDYVDPGAVASDIADGNVAAMPMFGFPSEGLVLHLAAGNITGLADGGPITNWPDVSGEDNHADNIAGDPTWHENALNSHPVIRLDGDDLVYTTKDFSAYSEYTCILVARYTGGQSARVLSSRNGRNWLLGYWGNRVRSFHPGGWVHNPGGTDTNWHLHAAVVGEDLLSDWWVDRQLLQEKKNGATAANYRPREIQLGGYQNTNERSKCEAAELLFYNRKLDKAELLVVQGVLDSKYALGFGETGDITKPDSSAPGIYNVTYLAADSSGNMSTAVRRVTVLDPSILPVITLVGDAEITMEAGDAFVDPGATVSDPQGQPIDLSKTPILVTGQFDSKVPGNYNLAYDFLSEDRRRAVTVLRKYTVVDTTGPAITLESADILRFPVGADYVDPGATAVDVVDGELTISTSLIRKNSILHRGHMNGWSDLDVFLDGNKGILIRPNTGENFLTGPLDISGDSLFQAAGVGITRNDTFQNLFLSDFLAKVEGHYEFAVTRRDDWVALWLDLDRDGVFEKHGDNGSEWINNGILVGGRIVYLTPGFYKFAVVHKEGGGGSGVGAGVRTPEGAGPEIMATVDPSDPAQDGLWNFVTVLDGGAPGEHAIEYTATDAHGNTTTVTRTVIFESNPDAPILFLQGDRDMTLAAGADFTDLGATVESKDGAPLDASGIVVSGEVDTSRPGLYTLKYNFVEPGTGIAAKALIRKVLVTDLVPPVITLNGDAETTHHIGSPWVDPGATATDNVDGDLTVKTTETVPATSLVMHLDASRIEGLSNGEILPAWRDVSGNQNHLDDNIGAARYLAEDTGGLPAVHFDGNSFYATAASFGRKYTVASVARYDGARNNRLIASRTHNWIFGFHGNHVNSFHPNGWAAGPADWQPGDTLPHLNVGTCDSIRVQFWGDGVDVVTMPNRIGDIGQFQLGAYQEGSEAGSGMVSEVLMYDRALTQPELDSIQFYLNKKYGLDGDDPVNGPVDPTTPGDYEILYSVTDSSGNEVTARRIVHVIPAPGAPILTLNGEAILNHQANDAYDDPGVTLTDSDGNALDESLVNVANPVDANTPGEYTITYNYTDDQGRPAPEARRLVIVADTRPPVITMVGDSTIRVEKDALFVDPGATAADSRDGVRTAYSSLDIFPGRLNATGYLVTFSDALMDIDANGGLLAETPVGSEPYHGSLTIGSDAAFRATTSGINRNDRYAINYNGLFIAPEDGTYEFGNSTIDDRMAFWVDLDKDGIFEADGDLGSESFVPNWRTGYRSVNLDAGRYNVAILFMENGGGARFAPTLQVPGGSRQPIDLFAQSGYWATPSSQTIDTSTPGEYTYEYVAIDKTGNIGRATRTVVVVEDASVPFLVLNGGDVIEQEAGTDFDDPGAKATDSDGNILDAKVLGEGTVLTDVLGEYILTYNFTDGNQKDALPVTRTIRVVDTINPVITLVPHANGGVGTVTLLVGENWTDPGATVTDNMDTGIQLMDRSLDAAAYYSFDDQIDPGTDNTFTGQYPGNLVEGARWSEEGRIGGAMELPAASRNARMEVGPIEIESTGWAFTAWFKELHTHGNWRTLVRGQANDHQVILQNSATLNALGVYDNAGAGFVRADYNLLKTDKWMHIAAVGKEGSTHFYIDGNWVGASSAQSETDIWRIGAWPGQGFARLLDEIYVYTRPLGADEAKAVYQLSAPVDTSAPGTYTVPYFAQDWGGNFVMAARTVIVEPDPAAPLLELNGDAVLAVEAGSDFTDPGATAKQEDGTVLDANVVGEGTVDTSAPGDYVLTYNFTDGQAKQALPASRTIQVRDTVAPDITLAGPSSIVIALGDEFIDPGATAADTFDGDVVVESNVQFPTRGLILDLDARSLRGVLEEGGKLESWPDSSGNGHDMDNYDAAGNQATWHDNVLNGFPVLRTDGQAHHWTTRNFDDLPNGYTILTIARYYDLSKTGRVIASKTRNWLFGFFTNTTASWHPEGWVYNQDAADTEWHLHAGKVIPAEDPTANFWKNGILRAESRTSFNNVFYKPGMLAIGSGRNINEQPATAEISRILLYDRPLEDAAVEIAIRMLQSTYGLHGKTPLDGYPVPTDREGEHTITYSAIDAAGNESTTTRTVILMDNPPVPAITLLPDEDGNIHPVLEAGTPFADPGFTLNDRYGKALDTSLATVQGTVDHTALGTYSIQYDYTDDKGFPANRKVREIQVVDTTAPEITLVGATRLRIPIGSAYGDPGFSAVDNLDGNVPVLSALKPKVDGLVINWNFDDNTGDSLSDIISGINGTLKNFDDPDAAWVAGKYGTALQFDGVKNYVEIPGTALLDLPVFTFSFWVKSDGFEHDGFLFEKTTDGTLNTQYNFFFDSSNVFKYRILDAGNIDDSDIVTTDYFQNGEWHHIAATFDGSRKTLYIDGEEAVITDVSATIDTNPNGSSFIGAYAGGGGYYYNGLLDEFQVYDRVLTKSDISIIQGPSGIDYTKKSTEPYLINYTATDSQGNSVTIQRQVAVSDDANAPVLQLVGDSEITLALNADYTDQGATASDETDGLLTPFIVVTGEVDTTKAGLYTITYSVEDFSFNVANPVTRKVTVGAPDPVAAWVITTGLDVLTTQEQALDADPDKDQVLNLLEYAFGSDPTVAADIPTLPVANVSGNVLTITFPCIKDSVDPDIAYIPQVSDDLKTWGITGVVTTLSADQGGLPSQDYERMQATFTLPDGTARKFIRILITR